MKIINLRDYYPFYPQDTLLEVPDEVAETLAEAQRLERNYISRMYYHKAQYSLDAGDGIEASAVECRNLSPEVVLDLMFYCRIPFSRYDPYLNGYFRFDYKMLGARNWKKWGQYNYFFEKQTPYGYTEQEYLAEPQITIFDDTLLAEFQP